MLAKQYRLPSYLIPQLLKKGRRFYSQSFVLIAHQSRRFSRDPVQANASPGPSRFAFIVSKKIDKRASKRNRFKRLLREAIRLNLTKIKPGYNIILLAKKLGRINQLMQTKIELGKSLKEAGLIKV